MVVPVPPQGSSSLPVVGGGTLYRLPNLAPLLREQHLDRMNMCAFAQLLLAKFPDCCKYWGAFFSSGRFAAPSFCENTARYTPSQHSSTVLQDGLLRRSDNTALYSCTLSVPGGTINFQDTDRGMTPPSLCTRGMNSRAGFAHSTANL